MGVGWRGLPPSPAASYRVCYTRFTKDFVPALRDIVRNTGWSSNARSAACAAAPILRGGTCRRTRPNPHPSSHVSRWQGPSRTGPDAAAKEEDGPSSNHPKASTAPVRRAESRKFPQRRTRVHACAKGTAEHRPRTVLPNLTLLRGQAGHKRFSFSRCTAHFLLARQKKMEGSAPARHHRAISAPLLGASMKSERSDPHVLP